MQGNMAKAVRKRASRHEYISPNQLTLEGFESPFSCQLDPENRWVTLAKLIPWDEVCNMYLKIVGIPKTGRPPLNPRIVLGALIIKHLCNFDDRETVNQITENVYMQHFLGYTSFTTEPPFDPSLFVEFRKRLGMENLNAISERIVSLKTRFETAKKSKSENQEEDVTSNFASSNFRKSDSSDFRKSKSPLFEKKPSDLEHVKLKTEGDEYKLKESLYVVQS